MNKIYRIIFNRNTGRMEVVSELAKARACGGSDAVMERDTIDAVTPSRVGLLSASLMLLLGTASVMLPVSAQQAPSVPAPTVTTPPPTQIVADPGAPKTQQPTVLPTANGSVQVNVQTPTAAGVSMNQYRQFDVGSNGAILNNSRTNIQTQTAGWIQGNPWLASGTAKVIVNQVNSTNPSLLQGVIEVAGDRAEVVIANAAGISVNGAGFLNASRLTLSTGLPQLGSGGALEAYRVSQGQITVAGNGLNSGDADYTQLLARSVQVNGAVWANQLQVVTGANDIAAAGDSVTATAASGNAPIVALDVGSLGGMYAQKIALIGTEKGLGINNQGQIAASAGNVFIDAQGQLRNAGTIAVNGAANSLQVRTDGIDNAGTLASQGQVNLQAANLVQNSGLINAGRELTLQSTDLRNDQGTISAQRLDITAQTLSNRDGNIQQTGTQGLEITASQVNNRSGASLGMAPLVSEGEGNGSGGDTSEAPTTSGGGGETTVTTPAPEVFAPGAIRITGVLDNSESGVISANGATTLTATQGLANTDGAKLQVQTLHVSGDTLRNSGEIFYGNGTLKVANLNNDQGKLGTGAALNLDLQSLSNQGGTITTAQSLSAQVAAQANNAGGTLASEGALQLQAATILNAGGVIVSNQDKVTLSADGLLSNDGGSIQGEGDLDVHAADVSNVDGVMLSNARATLNVQNTVNNTQGTIVSKDVFTLNANALNNHSGIIGSQQADTYLNLQSQIQNQGGTVISGGIMDLHSQGFDNQDGSLIADTLKIDAGSDLLNNDRGTLAGNRVDLKSGDLSNKAGVIQAQDALDITAQGQLDNADGQIVSGNHLQLGVNALRNHRGVMGSIAGATTITASQGIDNAEGQIQSGAALNVTTNGLQNQAGLMIGVDTTIQNGMAALDNTQGTIAGQTLAVQSGALNNDQGLLQSTRMLTLDTNGQQLRNTRSGSDAGIRAGTSLDLRTGALDNTSGVIGSGEATSMAATAITNAQGQIAAGTGLDIQAVQIDNAQGQIQSAQNTTLNVSAGMNNAGGHLLAGNTLQVGAASLNNQNGLIGSIAGDTHLDIQGALSNQQGQIQTANTLHLLANGLQNQQGLIVGGIANVDTRQQQLDNAQGTIAAQTLMIQSGVLNNDAGLLQASGDLSIDSNGQRITNANSGTIAGISSGGRLDLQSGDLDNHTGVIAAAGAVTLQAQAINNQQGTLTTQNTLQVQGSSLANQEGAILALQDANLNVGAGSVNNDRGLIQSDTNLDLTAGNLSNRDTRDAASGGIAATAVTLNVDRIDNHNGVLAADDTLTLNGGGAVDNTQGQIFATHTVTIKDPGYTRTLQNAQGEILAGSLLDIQVKNLQGQGKLESGLDMSLDVKDSLNNENALAANRDLFVKTQGDLSNSGKITAGRTVDVQAANIDNTVSGEIAAADGLTHVKAGQSLNNRGLIDGVITHVEAQTLNNIGSGRIYGDHLAIAAGTLNNAEETVSGVTKAGTLAARQRLDIGVQTLINRQDALIYSGGDAAIGGALDGNRLASGTAQSIENRSATIDVDGNLSIDTQDLKNIRDNVNITQVQTVNETVNMQLASWQQNGSNSGNLAQSSNYRAWQVFYLDPSQILETSTIVTPDGYQIGKAVIQVTDNTSVYYGAYGGLDSARAERHRLAPVAGTYTVYYRIREDGQNNPDQVNGGDNPFAFFGNVQYESDTLAFNNAYGTCSTNCVQLVGAWQYNDPYSTIENRIQGSDHDNTEGSRIAHHTAVEDVLNADAGKMATIRSGGDMQIVTENLRNEYGQIAAGGNLVIRNHAGSTAGVVTNVGANLYRTHSFNNISVGYNGGQTSWTRPSLSEQIGQVGGSITAGGTLVIDTGTLENFNSGRDAPNIIDPAAFVKQDTGTAPGFGGSSAPTLGSSEGTTTINTQAPTLDTHQGGGNVQGSDVAILGSAASTQIAASSLFAINPNADGPYLETDPRFTNYKNWLSSDWMIKALGIDPSNIHKRLGDGYYEQKMIRDQIAQLTGRRFLDGYDSDDSQYQALMRAGVTFANQYGLRPGIALSAEQMARLTSDIVWLVEEEVTLPDGRKVRALVPKVYIAVRPGDITQNGALLAANQIRFNLRNDFSNSGDIAGRDIVAISAGTINNLRGGVISADAVALSAKVDINNIGATIKARDAISLSAGNNINMASTTATQSGTGPYSWSQTTIDRVAGLYVTNPNGLGVIAMNAGKDVNLIGATISNAGVNGVTQIQAGGDVNFGAVQTGQSQNYDYNDNNYRRSSGTQQIGTTVTGANHIQVIAGNDINSQGANITSQNGQVALIAARDVNLLESRNTSNVSGSQTSKKSGLLSSTKTLETWSNQSNTANGTTVSGGTVLVQAGRDITTRGADVVATNDVNLRAGNNIDIGTAVNTYDDRYTKQTSKSGLIGASLTSVTIGSQKTGHDQTVNEKIHTGSTIGSLQGNVTVNAGNAYTQTGSLVSAPEGDVNINAKSIDVLAAQNTRTETTTDTFKQKGLTVSFNSPVTGALQATYDASRDVGKSKDARVNALAAANAGYSAYQAGQAMNTPKGAANNDSGGKGGNLSLSITYGQQQAKTTSTTDEVTNQGSLITGNRVNLTATGGGKDSNINVIGSDIDSKTSTTLKADNAINLLAAQDTLSYTSKNSSQGWNAGVAIAFGNGNGAAIGFTGGGNAGKGSADMDAVTQRNATVSSQGTTTLISGGTTTLKGAQVSGNQVVVDASDLKIESLQDTETYKSDQKNASAQMTVGYGFSASGSYGQSNVKSDYASVNQQSGILAGDGGYQIAVKGNTDLQGGIITSTQDAEDAGKNRLSTGTLTASDIDNHANYNASGVSIGGGMAIKGGKDSVSNAMGFGHDSDQQSSTTQSGINTGNIAITDSTGQEATGKAAEQIKAEIATTVTSDQVAESSGTLTNRFDAEAVEKEIDLQMRVTQAFDQNRKDYRAQRNAEEARLRAEAEALPADDPQKLALLQQADEIQRHSVVFDAIAGALGGPNSNGVVGMLANAAGPQLAYQIGQYFKASGTGGSAGHILAHGILGAALAAATGSNALGGALSGAGAEALAPVVAKWLYGTANTDNLDVDQKSTVASIVSLGAAGLGLASGQNSTGIAVNANVANNAATNNYLTKAQMTHLNTALTECAKNHDVNQCSKKVREQYEELSKQNDRELMAACDTSLGGTECKQRVKDALNYTTGIGYQTLGMDDVRRSALIVLDRVFNSPNAQTYFTRNIDDIDSRADFFRAMKIIFPNSQWFRVAEDTSRNFVAGLGAEGWGSAAPFYAGNWLTDAKLYEWRSEAGKALMAGGFGNFKSLFNNGSSNVRMNRPAFLGDHLL